MGVQINGDTGNISATKADYSGNVTIGGTLTYEDVTNIDSVGLVTAREGIEVGARPGVAASISVDGNMIVSGVTTIGGNIKVGTGVTLSPDGDGFFTGVVTATSYSGIDLGAVTGATGDFSIADKIVHTGDTDTAIRFPSADTVRIDTAGSNRFKIDSNGRIGILDPNLDNFDSSADDLVINGAANTGITINSGGTTSTSEGALVFAEGNGSGGSADGFRGAIQYKHGDDRMMFYTNNGERMRILTGGAVLIGRTSASSYGNLLETKSITVETDADTTGMRFNRTDSNSAWVAMRFYIQQNQKGYIQVNVDDVTYSTGSDYRLKENAVLISDGITRLKQLKPYKFNWKSNPSGDKVDGFFAHEVSDIVPQAVSGEKDAVDKDGNPDHQVIDHSKLVPLLTAALQEAVTEIESLKARLDAAGL